MSMFSSLTAAAVIGLSLIASSSSAHAMDCWVPRIDQATTGYGDLIGSPRHAALLSKMRQAEVILRNERALNALPNVRLQIKNFIGLPAYGTKHSYATVTVGVHRPAVWGSGCSLKQKQADYVVPIEFGVNFNDVGPVAHLLATPSNVHEQGFFAEPEKTGEAGGFPIYGRRVLALTPAGLPLLVPHQVSDHLRYWETALQGMLKDAPSDALLLEQMNSLRKHRAGLAPDDLRAQVALGGEEMASGKLWAYSIKGTLNAQPMVRINPALWSNSKGGSRVRLILLHAWINNEDDGLVSSAEGWVRTLDVSAWTALLDA